MIVKLLSAFGWSFISVLSATLKLRDVNAPVPRKSKSIYAIWHGEQFLPCFHHRNQWVAIMSSLSRDGEIQAGILGHFRYSVVRGSSTRGSQRALVEMIRLVRTGHGAAFAVDGPKGPLKEVKSGVVYIAQKTGRPLIPVSCAAKKYITAKKAWDKYELPLPFSKAVAVYGMPVFVKPEDDIEEKASELEGIMLELSDFSHRYFWSTDIKEYLERHPFPRILIVQPSRMGDVVFTLPSVHAIKAKYPKARISWIVDERCAPLLEGNPDIDEVIVLDRKKISLSYLYGMYKGLRARNFDLSIDFHGLFKSAFLVWNAGAKFKLASSSTNGMRELSGLFSKEIKAPDLGAHCVDRHFAVAQYLGCDGKEKYFHIETAQADIEAVEKIFADNSFDGGKPFAVIHPGGGWLSRRWGTARFAALAARLSGELGLGLVLVGGREGGAAEKGLNEEITDKAGVKILDLTGALTIKQLAAVLKKAAVFVANEAGPMHIATAMSVPAVALLGPTDASRTGPYGGRTKIIQHKVECQPCRERNCSGRQCMEMITVEDVFNAVKQTLCPSQG